MNTQNKQMIDKDGNNIYPVTSTNCISDYSPDSNANKDMSNLTNTGKAVLSRAALPSSNYQSYTPADNQTYTAPGDGYFSYTAGIDGLVNGYSVILTNTTTGVIDTSRFGGSIYGGELVGAWVPVRSGDHVLLRTHSFGSISKLTGTYYNTKYCPTGGPYLRFYPAIGA